MLLYVIQREAISKEITRLSSNKLISQSSQVAQLNPFLDKGGLLRVKGRLRFSDLSYESKHPVIIPKCHFGKLLGEFQHIYL